MKSRVVFARYLSSEITWLPFFRFFTLALLFVIVFYPVLKGIAQDWWIHTDYSYGFTDYSYGFIVSLLSGFLIWNRRKELKKCPKTHSLLGLALFLVGLGFFLLGWVGQEEFVQNLSFPLTLLGLVYFLAGTKVFKLVLFPIGYLFLMIPIPYTFYKSISLNLRLLDADLATLWSSTLGVPIFQEGYLLHLPHITLEVADVCSGVFSMIALLALGIFYIHLLQLRSWKKLLLWALLIPVAVLTNIIRIVMIVVIVHYSGNWILDTTFHLFGGTFSFLLGFMAIVLAGFLVDRIPTGFRSVA